MWFRAIQNSFRLSSFAASGEVVVLAALMDLLPNTFNMDPTSLEAAIALLKREGELSLYVPHELSAR